MSDSPSPSLPSLPGRIVAVFVSPGRLFEQLSEKPVWGTTMLLLVILNVIMMFLLPAELFEEQIRRSMADSGMGENEIAMAATVGRYAGIAMAGVMGAVGSFVVGTVLFFVFATLLGDNGRFRQYLSVVVHALVISSIGALIQVPLKRSAGDMELVLSLGTFAPFLEEGFVLSFLSAIGLFGIWCAMLMATGITRIQPTRSWGGAFSIVMALYCLFALGAAGITSMVS